jgi:plasmid maintenance system antidote protein VapI
MTSITIRAAAEQIGCDPRTVSRAVARLKIDATKGLTAKQVARLTEAITPGGRGHWTAGKRRNPDRGEWGRIRLTLARFLDDHYQPGKVSGRALAGSLGVSDRTVRRWIDGTDRPSPEYQQAIEQWMVERRPET